MTCLKGRKRRRRKNKKKPSFLSYMNGKNTLRVSTFFSQQQHVWVHIGQTVITFFLLLPMRENERRKEEFCIMRLRPFSFVLMMEWNMRSRARSQFLSFPRSKDSLLYISLLICEALHHRARLPLEWLCAERKRALLKFEFLLARCSRAVI